MLRPPLCLRPVPRGGGGGWPRFCLGLPYGVWLLQQGAGGGCRLRPLRQEAGELCIQPCWAQHAVLGGWAGEGDVCWGSGLRWEAVVCKGGGGGAAVAEAAVACQVGRGRGLQQSQLPGRLRLVED